MSDQLEGLDHPLKPAQLPDVETLEGFAERNGLTLAARQGLDAKKTFQALKSLPFWPLIRTYYRDKGMTPQDVRAMIGERLEERIVRWGVAV